MGLVTLDNVNIFGVSVRVRTAPRPRAEQINQYPGVSGIESLDMGDRGATSRVSGRLYGDDEAGLAAAFAVLDSYRDGRVHVLVDSLGVAYTNVKLISWEPEGRIETDANLGVTRRYVATLEHLTSS